MGGGRLLTMNIDVAKILLRLHQVGLLSGIRWVISGYS